MIAERLRKAVLQAAIQGKLTQQLPEDGDARDLLKEIQQEKARLVKEGKIKKEKPLPEISEDEIPFDIPENWVWCRLGNIVNYRIGKTPPRGEPIYWGEGYPWVSIADIKDGGITEGTKESVTHHAKELIFRGNVSPKGSLIMSFKLSIGKTSILGFDAFHNEAIITIDPVLYVDRLKDFLLKTLKYFTNYGDSKDAMKGKTLNSKSISEMLISLPPLEEQQRIINRLNHLLPELEKIEKDESTLEVLQKAFPQQLKNSILQAAIQGKLTQQLPEDGDARDLLKQIQQKKVSLVKAGKLKKENPLPPISEDEIPFDIPENWVWVRFGNIVNYRMGKTPPRGEPIYWGEGYPWVSIADINDGGITNGTKESITQQAKELIFKGNVSPKGSLIMSFKLSIGKTSILGVDAFHNEAIITINPLLNADGLKDYLLKTLKYFSNFGDSKDAIKGKTLNSTSISELLIPLPPLEEQQRIVERLEELLPLCEKLE